MKQIYGENTDSRIDWPEHESILDHMIDSKGEQTVIRW
jgi:hypothetical protein